ncbi:MAG: signal peptidase I [Treponema sp.]|nr:signal peptidase I [Treponema sp.]
MRKSATKMRNALIPIVIGICAGILIKLFALDILHVAGSSMEPAINNGDIVLVNKLAYGIVKPGSREFYVQWAEPKKNDVVIYLHDNKIVIKRCAATGGTPLEYSSNSGYSLHVGEKKIVLTKDQYDAMHTSPRVPGGYILALGDNYDESIDSRSYGFVSVKNIVGRIINR